MVNSYFLSVFAEFDTQANGHPMARHVGLAMLEPPAVFVISRCRILGFQINETLAAVKPYVDLINCDNEEAGIELSHESETDRYFSSFN